MGKAPDDIIVVDGGGLELLVEIVELGDAQRVTGFSRNHFLHVLTRLLNLLAVRILEKKVLVVVLGLLEGGEILRLTCHPEPHVYISDLVQRVVAGRAVGIFIEQFLILGYSLLSLALFFLCKPQIELGDGGMLAVGSNLQDREIHFLGLLHRGNRGDAEDLDLGPLEEGIGNIDLIGYRLLEVGRLGKFLEESLVFLECGIELPLLIELFCELELRNRRLLALGILLGDVTVSLDGILRVTSVNKGIGCGELLGTQSVGYEVIGNGLGFDQTFRLCKQ